MTCKFDTYENGKCFHAKHEPYGGQCEPQNCKLKNDHFPAKNRGEDTRPSKGNFTQNWLDFGIDPYTGEDV